MLVFRHSGPPLSPDQKRDRPFLVQLPSPKALPKIKRILTSFHEGTSDREEYWFNLHGEKFIHIEYIAVRRDDGTYLGCLEVGQDATYLRGLTGEKRR